MQKSFHLTKFLRLLGYLFLPFAVLDALFILLVFREYLMYGLLLLTAGILAGAAIGYVTEKRQLNTISKNGSSAVSAKILILLLAVVVCLYFAFYLPFPFKSVTGIVTMAAFLAIPAAFFTESSLIDKWERANGKEVMYTSSRLSLSIYVVSPVPSQTAAP
jgi:hypothetical protein